MLLALSPLLIATQAVAQSADSSRDTSTTNPHAAQPERPTVATHAYTVAPGYVEIETGVQDAQPKTGTQFDAPLVVKFGLARRLQLELQTGYAHSASGGMTLSGANDLGVALKQRLLDDAPIVSDLSVQGTLKFPTGATGIGTGTTDLSLLLISSRKIGDSELDLNAAYTHRSGDGTKAPTGATFVTASFGTQFSGGPWGGVAELFSFPGTGGPAGMTTQAGFLFGPTLVVRPWLVLDAGAILNVANMGGNAAYAGVTYNVGRLPGLPVH
ncbi:MAG: hypothetical protein ABI338_00445 [Gemmatimonadaceae bacterium]